MNLKVDAPEIQDQKEELKQIEQQHKPSERTVFKTVQFVHVICKDPENDKFLCINENNDKGWYIPAGKVESGETFQEAACRECVEESGVEVVLKGIINVKHGLDSLNKAAMFVTFYAEPKYKKSVPKQEADEES